jgi:hypothetical protein
VGQQFWFQSALLGLDTAEADDGFGSALATGDFNGDGRDDLAVGVPGEDTGATPTHELDFVNAGQVNVLYGTALGLSGNGNQVWEEGFPGGPDVVDDYDRFGSALATGDFNGDGYDDLAAGAPDDNLHDDHFAVRADTGNVHVLYGTAVGLSNTGRQVWGQETGGVADTAEIDDLFGFALAAGDYDNDGRDDLAVGAPGENLAPTVSDAGAVNVLYGAAPGLSASGTQFWHQDSPSVLGDADALDEFGWSLAAGNFDGDAGDDLAVGVRGEDVISPVDSNAGAVNVLYSRFSGLSGFRDQYWHQDSPGILDAAEVDDRFGSALAAGDFNRDANADLAVGVPLDDYGPVPDSGMVNVLYGRGARIRLSATGNQLWHQDSIGVRDIAEDFDHFGFALAAAA